jgi:uncharacterized membrane protein
MTKLNHKIKIDAPLEKVWSVLANLEEVASYNRAVKSARYISENRTGIGSSRQCEMDKGHVKERVTNVDERKSISMELFESDWPLKFMRWTTEVDDSSNGTTIMRQVTEYEPGMGILGKIMNVLVMKKKFSRILDELFIDLKQYVELKP